MVLVFGVRMTGLHFNYGSGQGAVTGLCGFEGEDV